MAIQDIDPDRRNLTVTSIAFIAYYYAGGSFTDNEVHLQVINAHFSRPWLLSTFAWIALFWFVYRYWLMHRNNFFNNFNKIFNRYRDFFYLKEYAFHKHRNLNGGLDPENFQNRELRWKNGVVHIVGQFNRTNNNGTHSYSIKLDDAYGWQVALRATTECMIKEKIFSEDLVPYLLAIMAMLGPIAKRILG